MDQSTVCLFAVKTQNFVWFQANHRLKHNMVQNIKPLETIIFVWNVYYWEIRIRIRTFNHLNYLATCDEILTNDFWWFDSFWWTLVYPFMLFFLIFGECSNYTLILFVFFRWNIGYISITNLETSASEAYIRKKISKTPGYNRDNFRPPTLLKMRFWEKLPLYQNNLKV